MIKKSTQMNTKYFYGVDEVVILQVAAATGEGILETNGVRNHLK